VTARLNPVVRRWRSAAIFATAGLGLLLTEVGHYLSYLLMYGGRAPLVQSTSTHAYFPPVFESAVAAIGAGLLISLGLIGLARGLHELRHNRPVTSGWPLGRTFLVLFGVQVVVFLIQETTEARVVGSAVHIPALVVGIGSQALVAFVGAVVLNWLTWRVKRAVRRLRSAALLRIEPAPLPVLLVAAPFHQTISGEASIGVPSERAPPIASSITF
jgi:hypothetical protein